jgi:hypothetical protein
MTAEACSLVSGTTYRVTNAAKRVLDPATTVTVKDAGTPIAAANVTIDYLFGTFTLASGPGGAVTVDAAYIPVYAVADCQAVDVSVAINLADASVLGSSYKKKLATLLDCSGSLKRLALSIDDIDTVTAGTQSLHSWLMAGTPRLLDVLFTTGQRFRAWVLFKDNKASGSVDGLVELSIDFEGAAQAPAAVCGFGS